MSRVLVTGANGFVGRHLVAELASSGVEVIAAMRSTARPPEWPAQLRTASLDLANLGQVDERTLHGVSCVYHLAAVVHRMRSTTADEVDYTTLNVRATQQLARIALRCGVRRFVYVSSIKVNGERTFARPFTAADPPAPLDAYGRSKLQAEQALAEVAASSSLEVVVVRPPLVYGPNVGANFLRLLSLLDSSMPLPFGAAKNRRSLVSVWNLVSLLRVVGTHPGAAKAPWLVSDGLDVSTKDLLTVAAAAMGRTVHLWKVPTGLLRAGGALMGRSAEIARLLDSLQVDIAATCRELEWQPQVSFHEGISRTVTWFLESKHGSH
jgi:nucleoside-diphosphate-sugar epimerase